MAAIYIPSKPHYENSPSFRKKMRNIFQKAPELFYKCSGAFWKKVLMKNKTVRGPTSINRNLLDIDRMAQENSSCI